MEIPALCLVHQTATYRQGSETVPMHRARKLTCLPLALAVISLVFILVAWSSLSDASAAAGPIPPDRRIEWKPGIPGGIPDVPVVANVRDFDAKGDGVTDDSIAFARAIDSATAPGAVLIPAGTYLLRSQIAIRKSVVLRGEGAEKTHLIVDHGAEAIVFRGSARGAYTSLVSGYVKDSTALTVADPTPFRTGAFVEIRQNNDPGVMYTNPEWNQPWAADAVGQVVKVVGVSGNTITIDEPLRLDYRGFLNPRIRLYTPVEYAGIERLRLTRRDRSFNHLIVMNYAAYSWVREVESEYAFRSHIIVFTGYGCEIRDNYIHHAGGYGDGGQGYGVTLESRTTNCLIENNIFRRLRHAMMAKGGSSGNVFGYNYSRENYQDGPPGWVPADISLHGHYPNFNLFEGNVIQHVGDGDYWGPSGPGNTFFRNRVESETGPGPRGAGRGIWINDYSHRQNVVGNEIVAGDVTIDATVRDTLIHGNLIRGRMQWNAAIADRDLPASYYLTSRPAFYGPTGWPSIGADRPNGTNPAKQRYSLGTYIPRP